MAVEVMEFDVTTNTPPVGVMYPVVEGKVVTGKV
jgi:hypothetical protein